MPDRPSEKTPRALGYRMPAEWEPHEATWLAWPHNPEDWPGKFQSIPWLYAEIVRLLAGHERVHLIVENASSKKRVASMLDRAGANMDQVTFQMWPTDRGWTRDSGPIFVRNTEGRIAITNWQFNGWAKYDDWRLDDKLPGRVAKLLGATAWQPTIEIDDSAKHCRIVLEGGSIDVNGAGSLLTTEECLLSEVQQRNPGVSRAELERVFHDYLGIDQTIWLNRGIVGDDTHGHVDDVARFVAPDTIVLAFEEDSADANYASSVDNLRRLELAGADNGALRVVRLPYPRPVIMNGQRLPASYANFYIGNRAVLVPTFNDPNDRIALNALTELFPDRQVVGIHAVDLVWGYGTIHCLTQQQPTSGSR